MFLKFIFIGAPRESFFREAEENFLKRLQKFAKISCAYPQGEKITPSMSVERVLAEEARTIRRTLETQDFNIALDANGQTLTSEKFADLLDKQSAHGEKITFLVGGPLGLAPSIKKTCRCQLSLSAFTFTHELARIVLLEQIYRALNILKGTPYHK
jgi:23S rRNA (pseudouridine1915-N3)-methyltransferase